MKALGRKAIQGQKGKSDLHELLPESLTKKHQSVGADKYLNFKLIKNFLKLEERLNSY